MTGSQSEKREQTIPLQKASLISEEKQTGKSADSHRFLGKSDGRPCISVLQSLLREEAYCFSLVGSSAEGRAGSAKTGPRPWKNSPCACECVRDCITYAGRMHLKKYSGWSRVC